MLTKNFSKAEMACKCGDDCGAFMDAEFMAALQTLRTILGVPLKINSAARCPSHNKRVGGVSNSRHLSTGNKGAKAVDISCTDSMLRFEILKDAIRLGFYGIGVAKNFIHIDSRAREQSRAWTY